MNALPYARLLRADVAIIAFSTYVLGVQTVTSPGLPDLGTAVLICAISTNFIYTFNAWADHRVDRVNKPWRPIPSGQISPSAALRHAILLGGLAFIYPLFIAPSLTTLGLFLLMPVLGILYSLPHLALRKCGWVAVAMTSVGLITPMMLGHAMYCSPRDVSLVPFFLTLFCFTFSTVLLKDIGDSKGDIPAGIDNLYARWGQRLLAMAGTGMILAGLMALVFPMPGRLRILVLTLAVCGTLAVMLTSRRPESAYPATIRTAIVVGLTYAVGQHLV